MSDIRQTKEYADYLRQTGWIVERINETNYFIRKFPLVGSVMKIQRPNHLDIKTASRLGKKYKAFQIIVEPETMADVKWLKSNDYRLSKSPYLPSKTLVLNLATPIHRCISSMKKDARAAIRKNNELLTMNYELQSLHAFCNIWKNAVGWKRYIPPLKNLAALKKSFGDNSLFLATKSSGAIFLIGGKTGYYWQAFTNATGRRNQEQYKIVWEGICWAEKRGAKVFDFEGIYDERFPNKSWLGFTHFKKSFGGKEVLYPGCYTKFQFKL